MTRFTLALVALLFASSMPRALAQDAAPPLQQGQLDALLAPVALYPDALLSKILIASTFPDQVLDAANWRKAHADMSGGALDGAVSRKMWDDNVKALVRVPGVLEMMSGQQDWMYQLGGAFVGQQSDVMASIQRLRRQARAHGSLSDTPQQRVVMQGDTIVIAPAQPQTIYVPYYNPTVVYGAWAYPAYQPYYWPAAHPFAAGLAWGTGVALSAAFWSNAFDWNHHNVWYGGGWYGHGAWNHGYYNNWHANSWNRNVNINNVNINRNRIGNNTINGGHNRIGNNTHIGGHNRTGNTTRGGRNRVGGDAASRHNALNGGGGREAGGLRNREGGGASFGNRGSGGGFGNRGGGRRGGRIHR